MSLIAFAPRHFSGVQALHRSVGWPPRSLAGWRWLQDDPARAEIGAPAGWVVEDATGEPAAFLGNLIQPFRRGDARLNGATGFSLIVSRRAKGASRALMRTFATQPRVFAAYTFNANDRSQPLYARHGFIPWPVAEHALKVSWPVQRGALLAGRAWRAAHRRWPDWVSARGERLLNPRVFHPWPDSWPDDVRPVTDLSDTSAYAGFWNRLVSSGDLIADRSPSVIRRRLSDPDLTEPPLLLGVRRGVEIVAVAQAMRAKASSIDAAALEIIDLQALPGEDAALQALVQAMIDAGRDLGVAKVRLQVVGPRLLARLGPLGVGARREGGWGHGHVRFPAGPAVAEGWSPTPYDADHAICLRPAPDRRAFRRQTSRGFAGSTWAAGKV